MFIKENKESKNITEVSNRTGKMVTTPPGAVRMELDPGLVYIS